MSKNPHWGDRRLGFFIWTGVVAMISALAVGFGGGIGNVYTSDNWPIWLLTASPIIPLVYWLETRRKA